MKYFIFLLACVNTLALPAQTTSTKKYHNGLPDTVWHIHGLDTFLTEIFSLNGRLHTRIWRQDSIHYFNNQGNIINKKKLFKNNEDIALPEALESFNAKPYQESVAFHANGQICQHSVWKKDTLLQIQNYNSTGAITDSQIIKRHPPVFEKETYWHSVSLKNRIWLDTAQKLKRTWEYYNEKLHFFQLKHDCIPIQYVLYDTTGKITYEWVLDSNSLIPFKDNGLCLYGFVNLKSDTIISARYERVLEQTNSFFQKYFIVQHGMKCNVLDALGNPILPEMSSFLAPYSENRGRADAFFDETWLRFRGKSGFGVLKLNGQIVLEPVYQEVGNYKKSLFIVKKRGGWGVVDSLGTFKVMPHYKGLTFTSAPNVYITEQFQGEYRYKIRYGLIGEGEKVLLSNDFQSIYSKENGYFEVKAFGPNSENEYQGKQGIFHSEKGWIFDTLYRVGYNTEYYNKYQKGYQLLHKNDDITVIDMKTKLPILPFECQLVLKWEFKGKLFFACKRAGKMGLFDPENRKWILPLEYEVLKYMYDTLIAAKRAGVWEIISYKGQNIENKYFKKIGSFYNYYFLQQGDSILFFNSESYPVFIHPLDLESEFSFDNGLLPLFAFDEEMLLLNRHLHVLNPPHFRVQKTQNGFILGRDTLQNIQILVDTFGKTHPFLPQYEIVNLQVDEDVILVFDPKTRKLGAVHRDGTPILPCKYFMLHALNDANVIWAKQKVPLLNTKNDSLMLMENYNNDAVDEEDAVFLDAGWTMHSKTGALLTQTLFDYAFAPLNGTNIGIGQVGGKQGLWNAAGENVVPPNYDYIEYDSVSEMFHLFETQLNDNQRVSFADAKGHLVADGLFTRMSLFTGDYAFVETSEGIGIVQKNGHYRVTPQHTPFQKNSVDLLRLMMPTQNNEFYYAHPYDTLFLQSENSYNSLNPENQAKINNLLLERIAYSYFILPKRIGFYRNISNTYLVNKTNKWQSWRVKPKEIRLRAGQYEVKEIYKTDTYLNFWAHFTEMDVYEPRRGDPIYGESLNFKWDGQLWQRIGLKDVLDLNASNMNYFTQLFSKKLSLLKDVDMDCSNPNTYLEWVEKVFIVLETGIQFHISREIGDDSTPPIRLKMSWAELKPILKKQ